MFVSIVYQVLQAHLHVQVLVLKGLLIQFQNSRIIYEQSLKRSWYI